MKLLNSVGIFIVQLHPNLKGTFSSTNLVSWTLVSGLVTLVLMATFIRVFICLQENIESPPHSWPGPVQRTSVTTSVNGIIFMMNSKNTNWIWPGILFVSLLEWRTHEQGAATRSEEMGSNTDSMLSVSIFSDGFIKLGEKLIPDTEPLKKRTPEYNRTRRSILGSDGMMTNRMTDS